MRKTMAAVSARAEHRCESISRAAKRALAVASGTCVIATASACGSITSAAGGCSGLSSEQQTALMSHARSDFTYGDSRISEITYVDAGSTALPEEMQDFGATRFLVARVGIFPESAQGSEVPGIQINTYFAADDENQILAPMRREAETFFDFAASDEPGWDAWAERVYTSELPDAVDCVQ